MGTSLTRRGGEDLIIASIFNLLDLHRPSYLDIGAHHPFIISNTALLYARHSRGVNVEANPELINAFHKHRPHDVNFNVGVADVAGRMKFYRIDRRSGRNTLSLESAQAFVRQYPQCRIEDEIEVEVLSINDIVERHCDNRYPDFLTIDVEGLDCAILASADFSKSSPKVICFERVTTEERAALSLLKERGYLPYARTWANMIMLRHDVWEQIDL